MSELRAVPLSLREVSRHRDDRTTLEAVRICTDGVKRPLGRDNRRGDVMFVNAASFLYGRCAKIAAAMGL